MSTILYHGENNPRNSEGSFIELSDGNILFVWSKYTGTDHSDNSAADLWGIISDDGGRTWGQAHLIRKNTTLNLMSVSMLRLQDGRIAMVYLRKNSIPDWQDFVDCRPMICFSSDEGKTWSEPVDIAGIPAIYLVGNNDRLVQLKSGRLVFPATMHRYNNRRGCTRGIGLFFLSDDGGSTWRQSRECCYPPQDLGTGLQEPGVIELADGTVMAWFRTGGGCQYKAFSHDGGECWTTPVPAPEFLSPEAPLSMKRDPVTGELNAIWIDYHPLRSVAFADGSAGRTPLVLAKSSDEGKIWTGHKILENAPDHGFAYIAMLFHGHDLLLGYCCGGKPECKCMLQDLKLRCLTEEERA